MRDLDIILFGATGFTGRLVAEHLLTRRGSARIALAGRDLAKLEGIRSSIGADFPLLVADSSDAKSLDEIASRARVVCSTVGPYTKYGSGLVAACAARGTDYCDLTGEPQWVRRMIDAHHATAQKTGARIVCCCGFDSIPSDLGAQLVAAHAKATRGSTCERITFAIRRSRGGPSGGTLASMFALIEEAKRDREARRALADPYSLCPEGARSGKDGADQRGIARRADLGAWTAPFLMAAINGKVVRRTNALAGYPYGRDLRYEEVTAFPLGARGFFRASRLALGTAVGVGVAFVDPLRRLIERHLAPKPGEGPTREQRERGFFQATVDGEGRDAAGRPFHVRARVESQGDPGYLSTSRMLGEAALCLALDPREGEGGMLTPAVAMGERLLARLRAVGMTFEVEGASGA